MTPRIEWHAGISLPEYAANWVDMVPHLGHLAEYARQCKTIVEFGMRGGVSTWAFLSGLSATGKVVSVDPDPAVLLMTPSNVLWDPRWRLLFGDDRKVPLPAHADLVFIDSSHEYEHTLEELDIAAAMSPKWILAHDYLYGDFCEGVRQAINEYDADPAKPYRLDHVKPSTWGLAVLVPR